MEASSSGGADPGVDATDDPLHGKHSDSSTATTNATGSSVTSVLRSDQPPTGWWQGALEPIVEAWPQVRITVSGDSAFSR